MFKNVAGQKLSVFAFDSTTNLPKTGDAANLTAYVSKDDGAVTVLADTSATEQEATNAKGYYIFDLAQAETNGDKLLFSAKSATANIVVIAVPAVVYTVPPNFSAQSIDSNGRLDVIKVAGTTQTAKDIGAAVPAAVPGANGGLPTTNGTKLNQTVDLTAATIQAIWDALTSALTTAGSIGKLLVDNVNATISSRLATSGYTVPPSAASIATAVWDSLTSALTTVGSIGKWIVDKVDVVVSTRLATSGYTTPPTVGAIADQVWDEGLSGHLGAGSTGEALNAAGSAGDPWSTALPGAYGAGSAGKILGDNLNATVSSRLPTSSFVAAPTANQNADALLDRADAIETGITPRQGLRLAAAAAAGELSGADSTTIEIQGAGVATVRITADVDSDGNRTSVVLNV